MGVGQTRVVWWWGKGQLLIPMILLALIFEQDFLIPLHTGFGIELSSARTNNHQRSGQFCGNNRPIFLGRFFLILL